MLHTPAAPRIVGTFLRKEVNGNRRAKMLYAERERRSIAVGRDALIHLLQAPLLQAEDRLIGVTNWILVDGLH